MQVLALVVIELLEAQRIGIEPLKQRFDAGLSVPFLFFALQQHRNALLQALQTLGSPGLQQVAATAQDAMTLQARGGAAQLVTGIHQAELLQLARLDQGGEPLQQRRILNQQQVGEQAGQIQINQLITRLAAATDALEQPHAQVVFLQG